MISLKYHAISLAGVFLALAVGVVLGASGLSDRLLAAVSTDRDSLSSQVDTLTAERDSLLDQQAAADQFAARVGPAAVAGSLTGRSVAIVQAGGDQSDQESVIRLIGQAGGTVTGSITLTDAVTDPARADQLNELAARLLPAGAQLPAASDTGSLAGGLLGSVMTTKNAATAGSAGAVWTGLADSGFVQPGTAPGPADMIVVLTGGAQQGADAGDSAAVLARLAAELDRAGSGAVLAGRTGSASATGPVGVARAAGGSTAGLSTVDDVQTGTGRVATVLALKEQLDGKAGAYGSDRTASNGAVPTA
ncbi:copper transporter [Pseudonocardia sp. WMMC193]|uniref:copper transporter n=1 Tax=Pseudonocardia sp. WMMC193 TaxID=2911965 RepID=UPI001F439505|nr:copper transporter [Pseudonocardia sp. WMMC193]MCF7549649.1 copper transporter [Pseudonocardia sp. WMMC193]